MSNESDCIVEAEDVEATSRRRLLRYPDRWVMTYEKRANGGGWYVRDDIELHLAAASPSPTEKTQ